MGTASINTIDVPPTVSTPAAASPGTVSGTTTALSVLGASDGGEANLTYTWATTGTPPAPVTFSINGTNAAKNTTATFSKIGSYTFQVTMMDANGLSTTSNVGVTVNETFTGIAIATTATNFGSNGTEQFAATALNQFGSLLSSQPGFTWSVSGGGTVSSNGQFTPPYTSGSSTLQATSGSVVGTLVVTDPGTAQWNGSSDASWNTAGTWTGSGTVGALASPGLRGVTGDTVTLAPTTASTINLNGVSPGVASLTLNGSGGTPTLAAGSGGTLHMNGGGQGAAISVVGARASSAHRSRPTATSSSRPLPAAR